MNQAISMTPPSTIQFSAIEVTLALGEHYAGIITGRDSEQPYHLILLPGDVDDITFHDATTWAEQQGGALPNLREQSLLYANLKDQFQPAWYWSSEQHAATADYAWAQYFYDGGQHFNDKAAQLRARAVRRLTIK